MRPPSGAHLSEASAKGYALLRSWEDLAPLDASQLSAVDTVAQQRRTRRLPAHLQAPSVSPDSESSRQPEASFSEVHGAVLHSSQAFFQWHAKLEALRVSEAEKKYEDYGAALEAQRKTCQEVSELINDTLTALNQSVKLFKEAVGRSHSLRETGERLVQEQEQLSAFAEAIRERVRHFEELESIAAEFHAVASSLDVADRQVQSVTIFEKFLAILKRLDDCIAYVTSNPQYMESASYEVRFRQLHRRALGGMVHRVREILKTAVKDLSPDPTEMQRNLSEAEETNNDYVKFRAMLEEQLQFAFTQLTSRKSRPEYLKALEECQQIFCKARMALVLDRVKKRVTDLRSASLEGFLRDGFSYLVNVCRLEHQLFRHFFPEEEGEGSASALVSLMEEMGTVLYDEVRPRLIAAVSLDELCDYVAILKSEVLEGQVENAGAPMGALRSVVLRTLADAQERLIYRSQTFVQNRISRYEPTSAEMASLPLPSSPATAPEAETSEDDTVSAEKSRETWYSPVKLVLEALEKLYEALEPNVFGGIAHDAILACTLSINKAISVVSKAKGMVEGQLFAIRHLLILREELVRFRVEFLFTEKDLDFTHMRDHMRRVLSGEISVFQLPGSTMAQIVSWTAPRVTDTQVDSKKKLEKQLKESCEALIMMITKAIVEPMLSFLTKASAFRSHDTTAPGRPLSAHAFASVERLAEIVAKVNDMLESALPELVQKMRIYLPQQGTFSTLYKPIKANIIDAHAQIAAIIEQEYRESNTHEIQLKTRDELISMMDAL